MHSHRRSRSGWLCSARGGSSLHPPVPKFPTQPPRASQEPNRKNATSPVSQINKKSRQEISGFGFWQVNSFGAASPGRLTVDTHEVTRRERVGAKGRLRRHC
eukprot:TRINITY_DN58172_c0_g1_i1.p2 TRINITY_DN58172_c0_g1~~TRINITY_DN58172_c0_g1_i1.p2  ORF type:complete len:102 (-),score=10.36 TRINITY_DN58172_c0_g1_i1:45-350(-)